MNRHDILAGHRLEYVKAARADWLRAWWVPALATIFVVLSSGFIAGVLWWSFSNWNVTEAVRAAAVVGALAFLGSSAIAWPWWARKIDAADKAIQQTHYMHWDPNPGLRRDWVRTIAGPTSGQLRAVFFHANDYQLQEIARRVKMGRPFNVAELKDIFGNKSAAVQIFYGDLVSAKPPLAEWVSDDNHRLGIRLLQEGRDHLFSKLDTPLPPEDESLKYGRNAVYTQDTEGE